MEKLSIYTPYNRYIPRQDLHSTVARERLVTYDAPHPLAIG